jgi:hypothetical protein
MLPTEIEIIIDMYKTQMEHRDRFHASLEKIKKIIHSASTHGYRTGYRSGIKKENSTVIYHNVFNNNYNANQLCIDIFDDMNAGYSGISIIEKTIGSIKIKYS